METTQKNNNYFEAVTKQLNPVSVASMRIDNPLYNPIFEQNAQTDNEQKAKWERVEAFSGLNNIFQNVGSMISASAGVKPLAADDSIQKYAQNQLNMIEERKRKNYDTLYKYSIDNVESQNEAMDKANKDYFDRLESMENQNQENQLLSMRLADNAASRTAREKLAEQQMQNSVDLTKLKSSLSSSKSSVRTPKLYVINREGVRVPVMEEEATKLYQIAKLRNLDADYNNALSENARKNEYNVMMQRAYLEYEKQK